MRLVVEYKTCSRTFTFFYLIIYLFYVKLPDERIIIESRTYLWRKKYTVFPTNSTYSYEKKYAKLAKSKDKESLKSCSLEGMSIYSAAIKK